VDDHGLFRESLSRLLQAEPDFRIAATCASATEALAIVDRERIDVVLLDYDLGEDQGSSFLEFAKKRGFAGRVLMVTAGMSDAGTLRAIESGAAGIFLKHSPPAQLVEAIYKIMSGDMWLDSRAVQSLVAGASGKSDEQRTSQPLTERERAVLKCVFEGLTNKEIATQLDTSEGTIKAAMQQLFNKTGVRTRSQLVRIALERLSGDWQAGE
jgi:DNA-binding NarL/FixJ family response regulator